MVTGQITVVLLCEITLLQMNRVHYNALYFAWHLRHKY